jgi:hypothetical protein
MSLVVVVAVTFVVFLYVRMNRQARQNWLAQLDLPGRWQADAGEQESDALELTLHGGLDRGEFVLQQGEQPWRGQWRLLGHTLTLSGDGREQAFDLHLFKPGNIGLEDDQGERHVLFKAADNVVPLRTHSDAN